MSGRPIQCSDDIEKQGGHPSIFQTGQEVDPNNQQPSESLQTDAELATQAPRMRGNQMNTASNRPESPDIVKIETKGCRIEATGLARALKPGAMLQVGGETNTTIIKGGSVGHTRSHVKNKKPLTCSQRHPTQKELDMLCENLNREWKNLGRCLNLDDPQLDHIGEDYRGDGQHEINYRVLKKWKETFPECYTIAVLANALKEIGRGDLADELQ